MTVQFKRGDFIDLKNALEYFKNKYENVEGFNKFKYALAKNLRKVTEQTDKIKKAYHKNYNPQLEEFRKGLVAKIPSKTSKKDQDKMIKVIMETDPFDVFRKKEEDILSLREKLIEKYSFYKVEVSKEGAKTKKFEKKQNLDPEANTPLVHESNEDSFNKELADSIKSIEDKYQKEYGEYLKFIDTYESHFRKSYLNGGVSLEIHCLNDTSLFPSTLSIADLEYLDFMLDGDEKEKPPIKK